MRRMAILRSSVPVKEAARRHHDGESLRSLSVTYGVTVHTLSRHLRRAGHEVRSRSEANVIENKKRPQGFKSRGGERDNAAAQSRHRKKRAGEATTAYDYVKALRGEKIAFVQRYRNERGCEECGEKHPAVLDLHHRDPSDKHSLLRMAAGRRPRGSLRDLAWADLEAELAKCAVLCSNCHRIIEWEQRSRNQEVVK